MSYGTPSLNIHLTIVAKGDKDKQTEAAPKVHRIRITLTSRHVKNVEKGPPPYPKDTLSDGSLRGLDCPSKRQGPQSQGSSASSDQDAEDYDEEDAQWGGLEDLGSV
jgi:hypothetical protein